MLKHCPRCGEDKPLEAFSKSANRKDGRRSHCKACVAAYRAANRDKLNEQERAHRAANRDKLNEQRRAYRAANRDKLNEQARARHGANRDKINEQGRAWRAANRDKLNEQARAKASRSAKFLSDGYIKQLLTRNTPLRAADIPDWLIEAKRVQLQLKRETRS